MKSVTKKKPNTTGYHFYVASKVGHKWAYLQNRHRLTGTENRLAVAKRWGALDGWEVRGLWIQMMTFGVDKQWGPAIQHRELHSASWDRPGWKDDSIRKRMHINVWMSHCAVQQTLVPPYKTSILELKMGKNYIETISWHREITFQLFSTAEKMERAELSSLFFFGCTHSMRMFPGGQRSLSHQSSWHCDRCSDHTGSLTHCPTRELWADLSFIITIFFSCANTQW